ncbi:MAG: PQQ-binding-like beta-propeller repeat protein [Phycisphaerae bacterium]
MRRSSLLLTLALTLSASLTFAENWPTWRGPRGDGISQEKNLLDSWPEGGPQLAWSAKVGDGFSTPIAADGKIYIYTIKEGQEALTCLDAATGKLVWTQPYGPAKPIPNGYPGTRATPTLEGNAIYTFGTSGVLVGAKANNGQEVWKLDVLKETGAKNLGWGTSSSPLVLDKEVIVQGGVGGPIAIAADRMTGKIKWVADRKGTSSYAAPILITVDDVKQVIIFSGEGAHALAPDTGKQIWFVPFKTGPSVNAATPLYRDHQLFISGAYNHGCQMIKVTATSAEKTWPDDNKVVMAKFPSPILDGDAVYANSDGTLKCVSWPDCQVKWESRDFTLGPGGSFVRFDDKLITLGETGTACLLKATPEGVTPISKFIPFPKGNGYWSSPLIYKGKLYLKGGDELKCYNIAAK